MSFLSDASSSTSTSSVLLGATDPGVAFLTSSSITSIGDVVQIWPSSFLASPPKLNSTLSFDGYGAAGWYKTAFTGHQSGDDQFGDQLVVAKFRNSLVATSSRCTDEKGPFHKDAHVDPRDGPAWERDYIAMLEDYQQQVILSILAYIYASQSSETPKIAYLQPLLVKAEDEDYLWYGIVENCLPEFRKPRRWKKSDWQHKGVFMKFRAWCAQKHEVQLDDPQGLFCDGEWLYLTDGIVVCRNVGKKYEELLHTLQDMEIEPSTCSEGSESSSLADQSELNFEEREPAMVNHVKVDMGETMKGTEPIPHSLKTDMVETPVREAERIPHSTILQTHRIVSL